LLRTRLRIFQFLPGDRIDLDQLAIAACEGTGGGDAGPRTGQGSTRAGDLRLIRRGIDAIERLPLADGVTLDKQALDYQPVVSKAVVRPGSSVVSVTACSRTTT
jgi:hypothetical protein